MKSFLKYKNPKLIYILIGFVIIIIVLLYFLGRSFHKEGFYPTLTPVTYSQSTLTQIQNDPSFNGMANATNLQHMGVPEEDVQTRLNTGSWPWSTSFTEIMTDYVQNHPQPNVTTEQGIKQAKTLYPEQLLVTLYSSGSAGDLRYAGQNAKPNPLKCKLDASNNVVGSGMYLLDTSGNEISSVDNSQLPKLIPGFQFLNEVCNPCDILAGNFDCPFALPADNTGHNNSSLLPSPYPIMDWIWGIGKYSNSSNATLSNATTNASSLFNQAGDSSNYSTDNISSSLPTNNATGMFNQAGDSTSAPSSISSAWNMF